MKILGERHIACIFIEYIMCFKVDMFIVKNPDNCVSVNTVIESWYAVFDEVHISYIPRLKELVPSSGGTKEEE